LNASKDLGYVHAVSLKPDFTKIPENLEKVVLDDMKVVRIKGRD